MNLKNSLLKEAQLMWFWNYVDEDMTALEIDERAKLKHKVWTIF